MSRHSCTGFQRPRVHIADPLNVESDLSLQHDRLTPASQFFIRSHFALPDIADDAYRLVVDGHVKRELSLSVDDLRALADAALTITMECAGNGRAHLDPPVDGVQWVGGAVGTADWQGVRLRRLLEAADVRAGAHGVLLSGADEGEIAVDAGRRMVRFERSVPLDKAVRPEVLVATGMNGERLPRAYGGPVRAVVGGWYGMASVKWLTRITVTQGAHGGYWETDEYSFHRSDASGNRTRVPVTEMQPKAQITAPAAGSSVSLGVSVPVRGFAWAGEAAVTRVDLSDDEGATWLPARLLDEPCSQSWTRWEADWRPGHIGERTLLARCHDDRGRTQPMTRDRDRGSYMINEIVPYPITVRG